MASEVNIFGIVIGGLRESGKLLDKVSIEQELKKWLPAVSDHDLSCYVACVWLTALCVTQPHKYVECIKPEAETQEANVLQIKTEVPEPLSALSDKAPAAELTTAKMKNCNVLLERIPQLMGNDSTGKSPYDRNFVQDASLQQHLDQSSNSLPVRGVENHVKGREVTCAHCNVVMTSLRRLVVHMRVHNGEGPSNYDILGASLNTYGELHAHERRHVVERAVRPAGSGLFTTFGPRQIHKQHHIGKKLYKCNVNRSSFPRPSTLHVNSGEKPYKCDVCGSAFTHSSKLRIHERVHSGEKPDKCDAC